MNSEANKRIEREKINRSGRLDLSFCGLTDLANEIPELFEITWLEELILTNFSNKEKFKSGYAYTSHQKFSRRLRNHLSVIPKELKRLINLKKIIIAGDNGYRWDIQTIENLPDNLTYLDLSNNLINEIKNLPPRLLYLNLSFNRITKIQNLPVSLIKLDLNGNIYKNNFSFRVAIQRQFGNEIRFIENLPKDLLELSLNSNRIEKIENLPKNLTSINLGYNKIADCSGLTNKLKKINLETNDIVDLRPLISLLKRGLQLSMTRGNGSDILLSGNRIQQPPEYIIDQGSKAVLRYFELKDKEDKNFTKLLEAKMIMVGDGLAGKTSIVNKFMDKNSSLPNPDERTISLDIKTWYPFKNEPEYEDNDELRNFKLNIWDFGGQGKYRDIQHFFCSDRSLYVFVNSIWDPNLAEYQVNEDPYSGFDYWINFVNAYGTHISKEGEELKSPVVYVNNKSDLGSLRINEEELERKYQNIEFHKISCLKIHEKKYKRKFEDFEDDIRERIKYISADIFNQEYPEDWIFVKKVLEEHRYNGVNYISLDRYEEICASNNLLTRKEVPHDPDTSDSTIWRNVLDRIGTIIYFEDVLPLKNRVVINPNWLKQGVQNALDYAPTVLNDGKFQQNDFEGIWKEFNYSDHTIFITLMKKFEICYEVNNEYYIPALFSNNYLGINDYRGFSRIRISFSEFMPAGIIWKLIINNFQKIHKNKVWRSGFLIEENGFCLEVKEEWDKKFIQISSFGKNHEKLRDPYILEIKGIVKRLKKDKKINELKFQTFLVCNCSICGKSNMPKLYAEGVKQVVCSESNETSILNGEKLNIEHLIKVDEDNNIIVQDIKNNLIVLAMNNVDKLETIVNEYKLSEINDHKKKYLLLKQILEILKMSNSSVSEKLINLKKVNTSSNQDNKNRLHNLILENDFTSFFNELKIISNKKMINEVIILESEMNDLQRRKRLRLSSDEEINRGKNRLISSLLELIDLL